MISQCSLGTLVALLLPHYLMVFISILDQLLSHHGPGGCSASRQVALSVQLPLYYIILSWLPPQVLSSNCVRHSRWQVCSNGRSCCVLPCAQVMWVWPGNEAICQAALSAQMPLYIIPSWLPISCMTPIH